MITKKLLKAQIDRIPYEYIGVIYRIIQVFENITDDINENRMKPILHTQTYDNEEWLEFINDTYGCFKNDPIKRWDQGEFEIRETIQ
ncbi:hypothetical protein MHK_004729 [Candidatus Magnetomorum sp. HK-1]|nr:hypothetical protein MHK_004729 [Candidatus Magnetomorum sp. HK-1]